MDFLKRNHESKQQETLHHHALNNLQSLWSNIIHRIPRFSYSNPNPNPFCSLTCYFVDYLWKKNESLSTAEIKKRMVGIPVHKISNYAYDAYGFISDHDKDRNIEFYYISKRDVEDFWHQVKLEYPTDCDGWQIFDAPLSDVVQYERAGPPVRLVPESSQVKNAIEERKKNMADFPDESFSGVPVFQSDYLTMKDPRTTKVYRPAYLRKEDLENAMTTFVEPQYRHIIQVAALEDIIQEMKVRRIAQFPSQMMYFL